MLHVFRIQNNDFLPSYLEVDYIPGRLAEGWVGDMTRLICVPHAPFKDQVRMLLSRHLDVKWSTGGRGVCPGYHLTFSAPKGLSIAALMSLDDRLLHAHEDAVYSALEYITKHLSYRQTKDRVTTHVPVDNILSAVSHRYASRAGDPLLHSQVIIFNFTRRSDDTFCAIDAKILFEAKILFGTVYRSELSRYLSERGIPLLWDGEFCDLECIDESIKVRFSGRRKVIGDLLEKYGVDIGDASQKLIGAVTLSSAPKIKNAASMRFNAWREQCAVRWPPGKSFALPKYAKPPVRPYDAGTIDVIEEVLERLMINNISAGRRGVARHVLAQAVLIANQGYVAASEVDSDIDFLIDEGTIIQAGNPATLFLKEQHAAYVEQKSLRMKEKAVAAVNDKEQEKLQAKKVAKVRVNIDYVEWGAFTALKKSKNLTGFVLKAMDHLPSLTSEQVISRNSHKPKRYSIYVKINQSQNALLTEKSKELHFSNSEVLWAAIRSFYSIDCGGV